MESSRRVGLVADGAVQPDRPEPGVAQRDFEFGPRPGPELHVAAAHHLDRRLGVRPIAESRGREDQFAAAERRHQAQEDDFPTGLVLAPEVQRQKADALREDALVVQDLQQHGRARPQPRSQASQQTLERLIVRDVRAACCPRKCAASNDSVGERRDVGDVAGQEAQVRQEGWPPSPSRAWRARRRCP